MIMTLNEISKNSFKVVIIGFGNIGKRYLEGIINSKLFLEIFIIDVNRQNFDITLDNKSNLNIYINFDNDLTKLPYYLDLVIISTTADVRFYVFKKILIYNTKYIILEKVLFSDYQHYRKVKRMIRNTPTNIWVNHPRRLYPLYQKLKEFIDNKKPINMVVNGGNWALASNSLHFVVLWLFLIGNHNYSISKTLMI